MRRARVRAWLAGGVLIASGGCTPPASTSVAPATGVADQAAAAASAPAAPGGGAAVVSADGSSDVAVPWTPGVVAAPPADVAPWGVWIPRLGVEASLAELGLDADGALDVPDRPEVAGWYVGGPRPGEVGPTVVAGHVDSRTGPAVFARLHELREGDVAHLVYRDGFVVTYRVRGVERYAKDGFPTAAVYGDTPAPTLRLITCGGAFDRRAGSYRENVVAYADVLGTWRYDPAAA